MDCGEVPNRIEMAKHVKKKDSHSGECLAVTPPSQQRSNMMMLPRSAG